MKVTVEVRKKISDYQEIPPVSEEEGQKAFLVASRVFTLLDKETIEFIKVICWHQELIGFSEIKPPLWMDFQIIFTPIETKLLKEEKINLIVSFSDLGYYDQKDYGFRVRVFKNSSGEFFGMLEDCSLWESLNLKLPDDGVDAIAKGLIIAMEFATMDKISDLEKLVNDLRLTIAALKPLL